MMDANAQPIRPVGSRRQKRISFSEFCHAKNVDRGIVSAFSLHHRLADGNFSYRTMDEWQNAYEEFLIKNRRAR